jgi:hypothetical protein
MNFRFTTNIDSKLRRENSCIKLFSQQVADVDEATIYNGPEYICDPNSSDPTKPVPGLFKILPKGLAPEDFMGLIVTKEVTSLADSPIAAAQNSQAQCRSVQAVEMAYDWVKNESRLSLKYSGIGIVNPITGDRQTTLLYPSFYYPNSGYFGNQLLSGEVVVCTDAVDIVLNTWVDAGISAFTPKEIYDIVDSGSDPTLYVDGMPMSNTEVTYTGDGTEATFNAYDGRLQIKVAADKSVTIYDTGSGWDEGPHTLYIQIPG